MKIFTNFFIYLQMLLHLTWYERDMATQTAQSNPNAHTVIWKLYRNSR